MLVAVLSVLIGTALAAEAQDARQDQEGARSLLASRVLVECGSTTNTLSRQEQVDFTSLTFVDGGR